MTERAGLGAAAPDRGISRTALLGAAVIFLVALNLRPAIVSVAPVVGQLQLSTNLGAAAVGVLTAIPLLCFGLFSPLAAPVAQRWGNDRVILSSMVLLSLGLGIRSIPSLPALFGGTVLIGLAITAGNVLVPAVIKRDYAHNPGPLMSLYSVGLFGGAALAAGVTVPLINAAGWSWRAGLAMWAGLALAAAITWLSRLRRHEAERKFTVKNSAIWRSPLAWAVTSFMGLQSLHYYTVTAWLPEIFVSRGVSPADAGVYLTLSSAAAVVTALLVPLFAAKMKNQRLVGVTITATALAGVVGLLWIPNASLLCVLLLGLAHGGAIALALLLTVLRSASTADTAAISGMSQGIGYLFAAGGPVLIGALHDISGGWQGPLILLAVFLIPQMICAAVAGASGTVQTT